MCAGVAESRTMASDYMAPPLVSLLLDEDLRLCVELHPLDIHVLSRTCRQLIPLAANVALLHCRVPPSQPDDDAAVLSGMLVGTEAFEREQSLAGPTDERVKGHLARLFRSRASTTEAGYTQVQGCIARAV